MVAAKEIIVELTPNEKDVINFSISNGFESGSIGSLEWELEDGHNLTLKRYTPLQF